MKKLNFLFSTLTFVFICSLLLTCKKETNTDTFDQEVAFAINVSSIKSSSSLKSALAHNLSDAKKLVVTIQNSDGSPTKYTSSELKIQQMNGIYYTQKIVLKTGDYKLTGFLLLDAADSTIFATPLTGSLEAQNVNTPLPVAFSVAKDITTPVNVEVVSTEKKTPEDFGLVRFPIIEVKTFRFMVGVTDKESDRLISAKITVSNGSYSYVNNLDSITNNVVTIKDGLNGYTLTIEKIGYSTYNHIFPLDSLKMHTDSIGNLPLIIELEQLTVTDYDGNLYKTVVIGNQVWMAENLKVTHYRNGDPIADGTGIGNYNNEDIPKYYFNYNDDPNNVSVYGRLYTWFAAADNRKVCPLGWHLPSNDELIILEMYLGGANLAGGKLKEAGTIHWDSPNTGATNESGFTCLPGGKRGNGNNDLFGDIGYAACHWSAADNGGTYAWYYGCMSNNAVFFRYPGGTKKDGLSIRCIKD